MSPGRGGARRRDHHSPLPMAPGAEQRLPWGPRSGACVSGLCPHTRWGCRPAASARALQPASPTGADRGVRLPLSLPPEPPDRARAPQGPLPAAHPAHRPQGPGAVLRGRRLLLVLLPLGEWGGRGRRGVTVPLSRCPREAPGPGCRGAQLRASPPSAPPHPPPGPAVRGGGPGWGRTRMSDGASQGHAPPVGALRREGRGGPGPGRVWQGRQGSRHWKAPGGGVLRHSRREARREHEDQPGGARRTWAEKRRKPEAGTGRRPSGTPGTASVVRGQDVPGPLGPSPLYP